MTHLCALVDDLLDISRITQAKIELRKDEFDLKDALHAAVAMATPHIDAKEHRFEVILPRRRS